MTDADGEPVFEDFDGLGTCVPVGRPPSHQSIDFGRPGMKHRRSTRYPAPITSISLPADLSDGGDAGCSSVCRRAIAELIAAAEEVSGMRILLVNRDDPGLIEVAAAGARDAQGAFPSVIVWMPLVPGHFMAELPGTHWKLLVLPDVAALSAAGERRPLQRGAALVLALLLISAALLFRIRRAEAAQQFLFMRSLQSSVSRRRAICNRWSTGMVTIDERKGQCCMSTMP